MQAAMLWQADEISQPIADEHRDREYQRQDPQAGDDGDDQNRAMEKQQSTRPQDRVVMFFRLVQMKRPHPLAIRRINADRCHNRHDQPGNQSASADTAAGQRQQVDSEQLQHECRGQLRFNRQQHLAVALRMQGVAMVVGMAAGVVKVVPPADQAEQVHEELVQPFRLEDRAMPQLMRRYTAEERGHRRDKTERAALPAKARATRNRRPASR